MNVTELIKWNVIDVVKWMDCWRNEINEESECLERQELMNGRQLKLIQQHDALRPEGRWLPRIDSLHITFNVPFTLLAFPGLTFD